VPAEAPPAAEVRLLPRSPGAWQPGRPVRTEQDEAEWRAWRRARVLGLQRYRRARMRRIDYYPPPEGAAIIDRLRTHRTGGDASSILNKIIHEWAAGRGVPELNREK
jgi:hypothetical protein